MQLYNYKWWLVIIFLLQDPSTLKLKSNREHNYSAHNKLEPLKWMPSLKYLVAINTQSQPTIIYCSFVRQFKSENCWLLPFVPMNHHTSRCFQSNSSLHLNWWVFSLIFRYCIATAKGTSWVCAILMISFEKQTAQH